MTLYICERWEMPTPVAAHNEWFADWALRKPNEVSRHLTMGYHALHSLDFLQDVESVHESFGGIGAQALMIEELWPAARHTVYDFSRAATNYMNENLPLRPGFEIFNADAYHPHNFVTAEVQVADVGDLTAHRWHLDPYKRWLDHTFQSDARAVVLTDIAGRLLHLHKLTYSKALGRADWGDNGIETYEEYLWALADMVTRRYGYHMISTFYHRWSAIQVFVPFDPGPIAPHLTHAPATPVGLVIL